MFLHRFLCSWIAISFVSTLITPPQNLYAQTVLDLPAAGTMVSVSPSFDPALIRGLTVHRDNPFLFDFIVDPGQSKLSRQVLKDESDRMIKYFFAALTIPDKDIWVNLSPYEKDRMVPVSLGETAMGRDLLAQDYMLKQLTASLIYPQKALGKTFWDTVYAKAKAMYGTTEIPVNTFNKVWIVPQRVGIYEHNQTAFIVSGHLKVMLEEDYLSLVKHNGIITGPSSVSLRGAEATKQSLNMHTISSQIIRAIILPEIEKEINEGKNFATLRQIFYAQALAVWFKRNLKQALLNRVYTDKGTVKGIDQNDLATNEAIYQQYLRAYKKGVFNYIKEDIDPVTQETLPRKYFSGGYELGKLEIDSAQLSAEAAGDMAQTAAHYVDVTAVAAQPADAAALASNADAAMINTEKTYFWGNHQDRMAQRMYHNLPPNHRVILNAQSEEIAQDERERLDDGFFEPQRSLFGALSDQINTLERFKNSPGISGARKAALANEISRLKAQRTDAAMTTVFEGTKQQALKWIEAEFSGRFQMGSSDVIRLDSIGIDQLLEIKNRIENLPDGIQVKISSNSGDLDQYQNLINQMSSLPHGPENIDRIILPKLTYALSYDHPDVVTTTDTNSDTIENDLIARYNGLLKDIEEGKYSNVRLEGEGEDRQLQYLLPDGSLGRRTPNLKVAYVTPDNFLNIDINKPDFKEIVKRIKWAMLGIKTKHKKHIITIVEEPGGDGLLTILIKEADAAMLTYNQRLERDKDRFDIETGDRFPDGRLVRHGLTSQGIQELFDQMAITFNTRSISEKRLGQGKKLVVTFNNFLKSGMGLDKVRYPKDLKNGDRVVALFDSGIRYKNGSEGAFLLVDQDKFFYYFNYLLAKEGFEKAKEKLDAFQGQVSDAAMTITRLANGVRFRMASTPVLEHALRRLAIGIGPDLAVLGIKAYVTRINDSTVDFAMTEKSAGAFWLGVVVYGVLLYVIAAAVGSFLFQDIKNDTRLNTSVNNGAFETEIAERTQELREDLINRYIHALLHKNIGFHMIGRKGIENLENYLSNVALSKHDFADLEAAFSESFLLGNGDANTALKILEAKTVKGEYHGLEGIYLKALSLSPELKIVVIQNLEGAVLGKNKFLDPKTAWGMLKKESQDDGYTRLDLIRQIAIDPNNKLVPEEVKDFLRKDAAMIDTLPQVIKKAVAGAVIIPKNVLLQKFPKSGPKSLSVTWYDKGQGPISVIIGLSAAGSLKILYGIHQPELLAEGFSLVEKVENKRASIVQELPSPSPVPYELRRITNNIDNITITAEKETSSSTTIELIRASDLAMATPTGGIDLSQQGAALHIEKDANGGVKVDVDPALIARVEREGMPEVIPVIINMQPADMRSLFGK